MPRFVGPPFLWPSKEGLFFGQILAQVRPTDLYMSEMARLLASFHYGDLFKHSFWPQNGLKTNQNLSHNKSLVSWLGSPLVSATQLTEPGGFWWKIQSLSFFVCLSQVDLAGPPEAGLWNSGRFDAAPTCRLAALAFSRIQVLMLGCSEWRAFLMVKNMQRSPGCQTY